MLPSEHVLSGQRSLPVFVVLCDRRVYCSLEHSIGTSTTAAVRSLAMALMWYRSRLQGCSQNCSQKSSKRNSKYLASRKTRSMPHRGKKSATVAIAFWAEDACSGIVKLTECWHESETRGTKHFFVALAKLVFSYTRFKKAQQRAFFGLEYARNRRCMLVGGIFASNNAA